MIIRDARPEDYASAAALEQEIFMLHYDSRPDFFRYRSEPLSRERYEKMLEAGYIMLLQRKRTV